MKFKFFDPNSGFTLVELLVVVAIVGILASISMANFQEYRKNANDAKAELTGINLITIGNLHLNDLRDLQSTSTLTTNTAYSPMEGPEHLTTGGHTLDLRTLIPQSLLQGNDIFFNMQVHMNSAADAASLGGLRESILINILACQGGKFYHFNPTNLYNHKEVQLDNTPGSTIPALRNMFCG